jgi:histidine kinase
MRSLTARLLVSHTLVALTGAATAYLVTRLLTPRFFDLQMGRMMGGPGGPDVTLTGDAAAAAANRGVAVGVLVALAVAVVAGAWFSVRLLRPLADLSAAAHRIAVGRYDEPVPLPRESELARVALDVNALAARLAETEKRRVRLLGEVAHEMRTPLTVLDGYVEGLQDEVFSAGPELYAELAGELRRLRRLSDDLGALSAAEAGEPALRREAVDVTAVALAAAERLRPQLHDAGLELETESDGGLVVLADGDRVAQVVTNLVGNALAATKAGGSVRVACRSEGGWAVVEVSDTGVGLGPLDLERVFERFYRAAGGGQGRRPGSGIGLTIARSIAQAHGGSLVATSEGPGRGAAFTLRLPLAR